MFEKLIVSSGKSSILCFLEYFVVILFFWEEGNQVLLNKYAVSRIPDCCSQLWRSLSNGE